MVVVIVSFLSPQRGPPTLYGIYVFRSSYHLSAAFFIAVQNLGVDYARRRGQKGTSFFIDGMTAILHQSRRLSFLIIINNRMQEVR